MTILVTATDEEFEEYVKNSVSIRSCIMSMGMNYTPGHRRTFLNQCKKRKIDTSHFLGKSVKKRAPIEKLLCYKNKRNNGVYLKGRLIDEDILKPICSICGIDSWLGQELTLQLDHINGDPLDDRLENLRLLCPNCHSQTDTYCGRNKRSYT